MSSPTGLGGGCRGDPHSTRRRPPERNFQSTRLPPIWATSSSPWSGTGRQQVGSHPGTQPTPGSLSHSKLKLGPRMASPAGPQPTKRPTVPSGPSTATTPVSATGAGSFFCAQPSSLCRCRRPAPSSTTKRPPTGPAATSRRRSGSSPCVKRATRSSALFSCVGMGTSAGKGWDKGYQGGVGAGNPLGKG
uniref:Uncharacterized protein n=1 Tax=Propithecus coquereli TaxID=379532 RepID=A0A2K6G6A5_PROCO